MKRKLLRFALWLLLTGCLVITPAFFTSTVHAFVGVASVITYYSDSTHTMIVGSRVVYCDGTVSQMGTVTAFRTLRIFECNSPN